MRHLLKKARLFSPEDRLQLLEIIGQIVSSIIGRYRRLAESGRVELSMTPYAHPMLPLLIDFGSAREAVPEMELPVTPGYPGGTERALARPPGHREFRASFRFSPPGLLAG